MTPSVDFPLSLPLAVADAPLAAVGGKGASLASLVAAGFSVPPGFLLTTAAYRRFVTANGLQPVIEDALARVELGDAGSAAQATEAIQHVFLRSDLPPEVAEAIDAAYVTLGKPPVAVRSSATAEDLPGLSFAGQQETVLNVHGEGAVHDAVRRCWASLWSARAIAYRTQMGVPHAGVAMAVVVQRMAAAALSGILFTANPATGERGELVIDAAPGLGEAIVGGVVTPESYVIDRVTLRPTAIIRPPPGERGAAEPGHLLSEAMLRELARLGLAVETHFAGVPQDIEWALADGHLWLLQARPITTLPEAPAVVRWEPPTPDTVWVRRQVVEHMPEPLSPLFAELYLRQGLEWSIETVAARMGVADFFAEMLDGPFFTTVHGYGYSRGDFRLTWRIAISLLRAWTGAMPWLFRHGVAYWHEEALPSYLATIARWDATDTDASDSTLLRGVRELAWADARYWFAAALAIGTAKVSDAVLDEFLRLAAPGRALRSGQYLRGFPSRTLAAEAELAAIAARVRESDRLRELVLTTPAEHLLDSIPAGDAGDALRDDLRQYFARYGHQIYNLDFVAPTLRDEPLPVLLGLKALVREPERDAAARHAGIARECELLIAATAREFDLPRRLAFLRLVRWAAHFAPYREEALFFVGAAWPTLRRLARELGRRLTAAGLLRDVDDVFFLESGDLEQAIASRASGERRTDLLHLADERRALRDAQKRLHPPAAVPPEAGMRLGPFDLSRRETQQRNDPGALTLRGFAVSPGRVTAPASVILSPAEFVRMEPGTILVCPTTTPAWTPLFAQARGLVTDIGGILAHGSIVAREYGIPAVMGTGSATRRITNGQLIAIDGAAGTVSLEVGARAPLTSG